MAEETFDFADFSLQGESASSARPTGDYPSIDEVLNKPIWCTGFSDSVKTENGNRTLVKFKWELVEAETAFWTSSKKLLSVLQNPSIRFPFHTIIKVVFIRDMAGFEFRSAKEAISQDNVDALNMYLIKKRSYMKQRR
ncbi:hypothetical protein [Muribaculum intestinale]|uniref:hypothetical protein n=1 Tax=Muribaculum intestinale TaxID=1796646 RepID=UPI00242F793D|nr:hypothetical protein [Muribaculum intestinale]